MKNSDASTESCLEDLHRILLEERSCIRELRMDRLTGFLEEKKKLLVPLECQEDLPPHLYDLAETIRSENRRNAYLLKSSLHSVRSLMEIFGKTREPSAYSCRGNQVVLQMGGGLLSGRV